MIEVEHHDGVEVLRMGHGKANALDRKFCRELNACLEGLAQSAAQAVVLTGEGRIFSAGVDLVQLAEGGAAYVEAFLPVMSKAFTTLFAFPKPVVAAVNGHAVAGGCILACACDHRVMARGDGRVGVPELLVGVPFPAIALEITRFGASPRHFQELVYRGLTVLPEDALRCGLVDELVEPAQLLERALQAARFLGRHPPVAFSLTKRLMREPALERARQLGAALDAKVLAAWKSPETLAHVQEYVEKTLGKRPR